VGLPAAAAERQGVSEKRRFARQTQLEMLLGLDRFALTNL
jgi:hypothetical protein